jgi:hypothetical protein
MSTDDHILAAISDVHNRTGRRPTTLYLGASEEADMLATLGPAIMQGMAPTTLDGALLYGCRVTITNALSELRAE